MGETATLTSQATLSIHPHTEDDGFGSRSSISLRITSRTGCQAAEVSCRVTYVAHDEKKTHAIRSLDAVSLAIIEQLQEDGRRPYAAIGKAVGLSEAAVRQRVQKLQDQGVVDLDAPLRDSIPALARNMVRYREAASWWIIASGSDPHAVCECEF